MMFYEWLNKHYPNAVWFTDRTGEIIICLGINTSGEDCF
jgi:hypothetical protein